MKLRNLLLGIALVAFFVSLSDVSLAQEPQKKKTEKKAKTEVKEKSKEKEVIPAKKSKPGEPIPGAEVTLEQEPDVKKSIERQKEDEPAQMEPEDDR